MAATNYTPISLYYSSTATNTPSAGNLVLGELAINIADGKLFYKNPSNVVTLLASSAGVVPSPFTANGVVYASSTSALTTGSALTFDGTSLGIGGTSALAGLTINRDGTAFRVERGSAVGFLYNTGTASTDDFRVQSNAGGLDFYSTTYSKWTIGGSEQMRLTSTGLGIGTSSPARKLQVNSGEAVAARFTRSGGTVANNSLEWFDGTNGWYAGVSGGNFFGIAYNSSGAIDNAALRLDSSGNLGLGVTPSTYSVGKAFEIVQSGVGLLNSGSNDLYLTNNAYYNSGWKYGTSSVLASQYRQNSGIHSWFYAASGTAGSAVTFTQAMTLDASGNLLVGTTSGSIHKILKSSASDFTLQVANTSATTPYVQALTFTAAAPNDATSMFLRCDDTGATGRIQLRSNGGIANYSANNVNLSDRREKTNFAPAKSYLDVICAIPVQTFNYIDQNLEDDPGLTLGVVAQDVQAVAPELVSESNWGTETESKTRLSIYQTDLQYALMKCIQELKAEVDSLKFQLNGIKP